MKFRLKLVSLAALSFAALVLSSSQPAWASGDYYVNADSSAKSDENSCRTKAAPCATLNGVLNKIQESATPQDSTVHAKGTFTEGVNINSADLEGLTLTWLNEGTRPIVDATGESAAVVISNVDRVSIKHFDLRGAETYGLYAYGAADTHLSGVTLQDNIIQDLDATTTDHYGIFVNNADDALIKGNSIRNIGTVNTNVDQYGSTTAIYVLRSDRPRVLNNTVRDIAVEVNFTDENSYIYPLVSGIYVYEADEAVVKNNEIKDIVALATQDYASGYVYSYTYGIYLYNSLHSTISQNTIRRPKAIVNGGADGVVPYAYMYGIYAGVTDDTVIHRNKILSPQASAEVFDTESGQVILYGIFTDAIGQVNVTRNTLKQGTARAINGSVSPVFYGFYINDVEQPYIAKNTLLNSGASADGTGNATTYAMRITDSPKTNIVHNRLRNFTADVASDEATGDSLGIYIDYNSSADILNNLLYFTESTTQNNIDGIVVDSAQAEPVRIYHNTLRNMRTCLQVDNGGVLKFENNICALTTSGAYGVQVDTDVYDLTNFISNYNIFFNSAETIQMNDTALGILSWGDWRSGEYKQDKQSSKQNPLLNLSDPAKKGYLHLKTDSPAINAGDPDVSFGEDAVMNAALGKDWDNDIRPQGSNYDIGADEYTL